MDQGLNTRAKTTKLLGKKHTSKSDLELGNSFLDMSSKAK